MLAHAHERRHSHARTHAHARTLEPECAAAQSRLALTRVASTIALQACVRISERQSLYASMMQRWLHDFLPPTAGVSTAAGADYALLQLPDWSSLRKATGCSNPRCLNAAGSSEASLTTMKCGACGLRYCSRECQAAAYKVHKHVCGGNAAEWMAKAGR
jgi:hypothetical protein